MAAEDSQQMRERLDRIRCSFDQWRISYELHRPEGGRWVAWRIDPLEEWEAEAGLTCVVSAWDHDTFLARLGAEQRRQDELRARLRQEEEERKSRSPLSPMRQRGEGSRGGCGAPRGCFPRHRGGGVDFWLTLVASGLGSYSGVSRGTAPDTRPGEQPQGPTGRNRKWLSSPPSMSTSS